MGQKLKAAVRQVSTQVQDCIHAMEAGDLDAKGLREARDLLRVLANVTGGMDLRTAYGAPGDWGYHTPLGDGLIELLNSPK